MISLILYGGTYGIRTHDPVLRRHILYPTELKYHIFFVEIIIILAKHLFTLRRRTLYPAKL